MTINIGGGELKELKPRILVMGIGGAGGNAINAMITDGMQGVEFVAVNTDAQDLDSPSPWHDSAAAEPCLYGALGKCVCGYERCPGSWGPASRTMGAVLARGMSRFATGCVPIPQGHAVQVLQERFGVGM